MRDVLKTVATAAASAIAAGLITWTSNALTLTGRVAAIEQSLARIEARLDARELRMADAK